MSNIILTNAIPNIKPFMLFPSAADTALTATMSAILEVACAHHAVPAESENNVVFTAICEAPAINSISARLTKSGFDASEFKIAA
jgi:hypothetical protein